MIFQDVVTACGQADARRLVRKKTDRLVIIDRNGPRSVLFQCPCGCGDTLVINVDRALKRSWRLRHNHRGVSLMPSVWRTTGCRSHFVLWENRVWWCGLGEWDDDALPQDESWPEEMTKALRCSWTKYRDPDGRPEREKGGP